MTLRLDQPASAILCAGAFAGYSNQTRWKGCTSTGQNLTITKTDAEVMPVFGGFAGYADSSSFSGCTIDGTLSADILPSGRLSDALGGHRCSRWQHTVTGRLSGPGHVVRPVDQ